MPDEKHEQDDRQRGAMTKPPVRKSRRRRLQDEYGSDFEPDMPAVDGFEHMVEYLWQVGPVVGDGAVTHAELHFFQQNTGIVLSEWEATTLRRLSVAYLNESHSATEPSCAPPWAEGMQIKAIVSNSARSAIRALASM
ncbi:MAG: hypothetical protein K2X55_00985 [Burkholderiaceae bacterium]|nr:hypothetical protein [Burkholderiaceae bacterium]